VGRDAVLDAQAGARDRRRRAPAQGRSTLWQTLRGVDDGRTIARRVRRADSFLARLVGLMGRSRLGADEGLYLPGTSGVHMFFMRFAIDCIFLSRPAADGTQRVVAIRRGLRPWRGVIWHVPGAAGVVELGSGALEASRVQRGDVVRFDTSG
jgi:hypothetical protein